MIELPDQPLAERVLAGALDRGRVPQQFLLFGPPGTGKRAAADAIARHLIGVDSGDGTRPLLDLSIVRASGAQILVEDLEDALRDLATRPVVGRCRVAIIEGAERLRDVAGNRILKPLEEPPAGSHLLLVTDHAEDLLPTVRSRCVPVPFRRPGWRTVAQRLIDQGTPPAEAEAMARAHGVQVLGDDPFLAAMRSIGTDMGMHIVEGSASSGALVVDTQRAMETAAAESPSDELVELRRAAADLEGKRGGKTAAKRAEDQEKRERRRRITDGWDTVLTGAANVVADALAVALGSPATVRNRHLQDRLVAAAADAMFCERAIEVMEHGRGELRLNPTVDVAVEVMLIRIDDLRHGVHHRLSPPGRLPW
ncbi:MAG: hypothetical protein KDC36_08245 [Thermoleophilia bacterium]|nr:hypothetical protein [Thermoleophilia bacterium]